MVQNLQTNSGKFGSGVFSDDAGIATNLDLVCSSADGAVENNDFLAVPATAAVNWAYVETVVVVPPAPPLVPPLREAYPKSFISKIPGQSSSVFTSSDL